jgi:hypothetical protein
VVAGLVHEALLPACAFAFDHRPIGPLFMRPNRPKLGLSGWGTETSADRRRRDAYGRERTADPGGTGREHAALGLWSQGFCGSKSRPGPSVRSRGRAMVRSCHGSAEVSLPVLRPCTSDVAAWAKCRTRVQPRSRPPFSHHGRGMHVDPDRQVMAPRSLRGAPTNKLTGLTAKGTLSPGQRSGRRTVLPSFRQAFRFRRFKTSAGIQRESGHGRTLEESELLPVST